MEIVALDVLKATQRVDTPTKIIENNYKIFPVFFFLKQTLITLLKQVLLQSN